MTTLSGTSQTPQSYPTIGNLWDSTHGHLHFEHLRAEAQQQASQHTLPISLEGWKTQASNLRSALQEKLHLYRERPAPDAEFHGDIELKGYTVRKVSFCTAPNIRMTGTLFVPSGTGPFPAVLNCHGHWSQGKLAAKVQSRGHILAQNGFVVLSVDAAGAGERGETERVWQYHGAHKGAELMLYGDTLLGWQVRDNQSALDFLESLPFVDSTRLGVTGASGGGNQTMWLSALDERIQAAVPVVSVGSFESYVGRRNCICETLPGGLALSEEWGLMGLTAPRPLLIITALHDQVTFGYEAMGVTARQLQEIYQLHGHRECFDRRIIDMTHGYHHPALEAMLGWFKHWLQGQPGSTPQPLPEWTDLQEESLTCYAPGTRPQECNYQANRKTLFEKQLTSNPVPKTADALTQLTGWLPVTAVSEWQLRKTDQYGIVYGALQSPRGIPLPIVFSRSPEAVVASTPASASSAPHDSSPTPCAEVHLCLSPLGKSSPFVANQWQKLSAPDKLAVSIDLPGCGEIAWEQNPVSDCRFHDTNRACIWLGYSIAVEWAECIVALTTLLQKRFPSAQIILHTDQETTLAALLARKLQPLQDVVIHEHNTPDSLRSPDSVTAKQSSLAWVVPGLLQWGDLDDLRKK